MTIWSSVRPFIPTISTVGCCGVLLAHTFPEVWGVRLFKSKLQHCTGATPTELPPHTLDLCQEVLDDIRLDAGQESNVYFFQTYRPWIVSRGGVHYMVGGVIGLPASYNVIGEGTPGTRAESWSNADEDAHAANDDENCEGSHVRIVKSTTEKPLIEQITDMKEFVGYNDKLGDAELTQTGNNGFRQTTDLGGNDVDADGARNAQVFMSEDAKRFAIAREVYGLKTFHVWIEDSIGMGLFLSAYFTGSAAHRYGGLKRWARVSTYSCVGLTAVFAYFVFTGWYHKRRQCWIDEQAVKVGERYANGAVEFYEQLSRYENSTYPAGKSVVRRWSDWLESGRDIPTDVRLHRVREMQTSI